MDLHHKQLALLVLAFLAMRMKFDTDVSRCGIPYTFFYSCFYQLIDLHIYAATVVELECRLYIIRQRAHT